jgi:hypothetical protein
MRYRFAVLLLALTVISCEEDNPVKPPDADGTLKKPGVGSTFSFELYEFIDGVRVDSTRKTWSDSFLGANFSIGGRSNVTAIRTYEDKDDDMDLDTIYFAYEQNGDISVFNGDFLFLQRDSATGEKLWSRCPISSRDSIYTSFHRDSTDGIWFVGYDTLTVNGNRLPVVKLKSASWNQFTDESRYEILHFAPSIGYVVRYDELQYGGQKLTEQWFLTDYLLK